MSALKKELVKLADDFRYSDPITSAKTQTLEAQLLMQLWSRDKQNKNAETIAKEVMKLIDKLDTFYSDLDKIQNGINAMQTTFDNAKKKLEGKGGVFSKGEKIKQLAGLKNAEIEQ